MFRFFSFGFLFFGDFGVFRLLDLPGHEVARWLARPASARLARPSRVTVIDGYDMPSHQGPARAATRPATHT